MASCTANGSNGHHTITLTVTAQSTNLATRITTLSYSVTLSPVSGSTYAWNYDSLDPFVCTYTIDGVARTCTLRTYNGTSTVTLASGTQDIYRADDGQKTVYFGFKVESVDDANLIGSCNTIGALLLTSINRVSTFTVPTGTHNIGSAMTISVTKYVTSYRHSLKYSVGTAVDYIVTKSNTTSISWTPPASLASQNINGNSLTCTLTLMTYDGDGDSANFIGSVQKTVTLTIPSVNPTFSITVTDPAQYEFTTGHYLNGKSIVKATMSNIVCANSAQIKSGTLTFRKTNSSGDILAQGTAKSLSWDANWTGTVHITGTITDTRNNTGTVTTTVAVVDYSDPTISLTVGRYTDSAATIKDDGGEYAKITYEGGYTSWSGGGSSNYGRITVDYKLSTASTWTNIVENSSTLSGSFIFQADQNSAYDVRVEMRDILKGVTKTAIIATAISLMDWRADGKAVTFGGPNTMTNALEIRWPKVVVNGATDVEYRLKRADYGTEVSMYSWASSTNPAVAFAFKGNGEDDWTKSVAITKTGVRPYNASTTVYLGGNTMPWEAIYANNIYQGSTNISTIYNDKLIKVTDSSGNKAVPGSTTTACSTTQVSVAGYYMVVGYQDWTASFSNVTQFKIVQVRGTTTVVTWTFRGNASGGGGLTGVAMLQLQANDSIVTQVYHTNSSTRTARTYIYAIRLMA